MWCWSKERVSAEFGLVAIGMERFSEECARLWWWSKGRVSAGCAPVVVGPGAGHYGVHACGLERMMGILGRCGGRVV